MFVVHKHKNFGVFGEILFTKHTYFFVTFTHIWRTEIFDQLFKDLVDQKKSDQVDSKYIFTGFDLPDNM